MTTTETVALLDLPDRFILRDGKIPKNPHQPGVGDHTDTSQHLSLLDAQRLAAGKYGLGFAPDLYHVVLDYDHVITNGKLDADIAEVFQALPPTYTEYSPSGSGLHSFYRVDATTYERVKSVENRLQFSPTVAIDIIGLGRYVTITGLQFHKSVNYVSLLSYSNFDTFMHLARKFTQRYQPDTAWNSAFSSPATDEQMAVWKRQLANGDTHNEPTCGLIYNWIFHQEREDVEEIEAELQELMAGSPVAHSDAWRKNLRHTIPRLIRETMRIKTERDLKRSDMIVSNTMCTHKGSAKVVKDAFGDRLAYLPQLKVWMIHKGYRFQELYNEGAVQLVSEICDQHFQGCVADANDKGDAKVAVNYGKWRHAMSDQRNMSRTAEVLKGMMYANLSEFEPERHYLNTESGIVDLRNGKVYPHDPKYKMMQICGCHYAPNMPTPIWDQFIKDVCCNDQELIDYLLSVLGYLITGEIRENKFFSFYGSGGNGKSTLMGILQYIMGKGSGTVGSQMMTAKASSFIRSSSNNDNDYFAYLATCKTSRILVCHEAGGGRRLDDERIKAITGGDRIVARPLFGRNFEYDPMFKLLFTTNDRLNISGSDEGIWRRALEFHFKASFIGSEDRGMPDKLRTEAPGILAKLVASAIRYYEIGLPAAAAAVTEATTQWKYDADPISRFLAEAVERTNDPDDFLVSDDLWTRFLAWKEVEQSNKRIERAAFFEVIKRQGFEPKQKKVRGKARRGYLGIRWVEELPEIPDGPDY